MRWRLYLEEYSPEISYIKGESNAAADALSRLPKMINALQKVNTPDIQEHLSIEEMSDRFCYQIDDHQPIPVTYKELKHHQQVDEVLRKILSYPNSMLETKNFHGGGKSYKLVVKKSKNGEIPKICVPKTLQKRMIDWYHEMLCHPGQKRMEETIGQHF